MDGIPDSGGAAVIQGKTVLAVIPARGGSKGLPEKNIMLLAGKPLIAWTIEVARQSKYLDRFILSTDSEEIAGVARGYQCEVPFMRPKELANDEASGEVVVLHALEHVDVKYDLIIVLQPTSPLRKTEDIDEALELMEGKKRPALVSVSPANKPLQWHHTIENDGILTPVFPRETAKTNRQDQEPTYLPNGALFIAETDFFKVEKTFYTDKTFAYIMAPKRSIDIDSDLDFKLAELLLSQS